MSSLAEYRKMMAEKKKKHDEENPKKKEVEKSPVPLESSKFHNFTNLQSNQINGDFKNQTMRIKKNLHGLKR
jgi:hypothetical protein